MADPFKHSFNPVAVAALAEAVRGAWPDFDADRWQAAALEGLDALELKGRVRHLATTLRAHLPPSWPDALDVLTSALPPPIGDEAGVSALFIWWPLLQVVEDHAADPERSLPALREMTRRFSAEFAVRPYLIRWPEQAWAAVHAWAHDPDVHVRRLASEGTRSRLPWGLRLDESVRDPSRGLAVIELLVDDPSAYVRRSVANHLGDVAKDHPEVAVEVARRWLAHPSRAATVRHALRHPLKQGHAGALALFGEHGGALEVTGLAATPAAVRVGERVQLTATITAAEAGAARADLVWQWPGKRVPGSRVLRVGSRELAAGEVWRLVYNLDTRPVTTRPTRPGQHTLTLRVNGADQGTVAFELIEA